ncbi:hypothetical protein D3874_15960 [Oleomonas cavernae]|uniref:Uncharacterized protein n=1 Tax=Oleomonas cavernae TaxID=2320859 RepID=A0A418WE76_9PROT|nr:hypothetical protein [Oleomonas cavernae]RJF88323.1 hypothetical protein D3874_15960 [Oleomonas cavernae]
MARRLPVTADRPPRRRANRGHGVLWGFLGAGVAGLLVGGLFWLDAQSGPSRGLAGQPSPSVAAAAPTPAPPPVPTAAPDPFTTIGPEGSAALPDLAPTPAPEPATPPTPATIIAPPPTATPAAIPRATLEQIATNQPTKLTVYRAAHNPRVLILDFPSLHAQAVALNRVAALTEKKDAPHDRVLSDSELRGLISAAGKNYDTYYGGHDYDGTALARFFTLAEGVGITVAEGEVLEILLKQKVLRVADKGFSAGEPVQAVISVAGIATDEDKAIELRRDILRHEMAHGEFFTQVFFRAACDDFWRNGLSAAERKLFTRFLDKAGYDTKNEPLVINEMQAYLGFTPSAALFGARQLGVSEQTLADLRARFREAVPNPADF